MLDFIVTHYNEPWEVGKTFFDMLACQRGIDFDQIRVILVHDGSQKFQDKRFSDYPYRVYQYSIEHGGVSKARNYGLTVAKAPWVCFCDFDDYYSDIYALHIILDVLDNEEYDMLWNPIYMEDFRNGRLNIIPLGKFNMIFIHNKYFRRSFLLETELKFNEDLSYAEDSAFLAVLNIMLKQERIGVIKTIAPMYTWAYRSGSCTTNPKNRKRNIEHLFKADQYIASEFERLGYEDATLMKFRAITDAYFALTSVDSPVDCDSLKHEVYRYWTENKEAILRCDREKTKKVFEASKNNSKQLQHSYFRPKFTDWLKEICA